MLVPKEVIGLGTHWYADAKTGAPRKYEVKQKDLEHWREQGNKMLSLGLTVPVPCEHDFDAHPMTPAEKLKSNAGWVKEYTLKDGKLSAMLDIQDEEVGKKLDKTIRWTSPWFSSFTDGQGRKWDNVVSHLALTLRPRVVDQKPFPSMAAAMAFSSEDSAPEAYVLSTAGRLLEDGTPEFPIAFSLYGGVALSEDDAEKPKEKSFLDKDSSPDMKMDELLRDLLRILGVNIPQTTGDAEFKRALYEAAMCKI